MKFNYLTLFADDNIKNFSMNSISNIGIILSDLTPNRYHQFHHISDITHKFILVNLVFLEYN